MAGRLAARPPSSQLDQTTIQSPRSGTPCARSRVPGPRHAHRLVLCMHGTAQLPPACPTRRQPCGLAQQVGFFAHGRTHTRLIGSQQAKVAMLHTPHRGATRGRGPGRICPTYTWAPFHAINGFTILIPLALANQHRLALAVLSPFFSLPLGPDWCCTTSARPQPATMSSSRLGTIVGLRQARPSTPNPSLHSTLPICTSQPVQTSESLSRWPSPL